MNLCNVGLRINLNNNLDDIVNKSPRLNLQYSTDIINKHKHTND